MCQALSPASYSYCPTIPQAFNQTVWLSVDWWNAQWFESDSSSQMNAVCLIWLQLISLISQKAECFFLLLQIHQSSTVAVLWIVGQTWWLLCVTGLFAQITIWDILISWSCSGDGHSESSMIMIHNHPSEDLICFGWSMMGGWLPTYLLGGRSEYNQQLVCQILHCSNNKNKQKKHAWRVKRMSKANQPKCGQQFTNHSCRQIRLLLSFWGWVHAR